MATRGTSTAADHADGACADDNHRSKHPALHPLQKIENFRDLAWGFPAMRKGLIFRGGTPADATLEDLASLLSEKAITALLDLRTETEANLDHGKRILNYFRSDKEVIDRLLKPQEEDEFNCFDMKMTEFGVDNDLEGLTLGRRPTWFQNIRGVDLSESLNKTRPVPSTGSDDSRNHSAGVDPDMAPLPGGVCISQGELLMLRPSSGKWRKTNCYICKDKLYCIGVEAEKIVRPCVKDGFQYTTKGSQKRKIKGFICLADSCCDVLHTWDTLSSRSTFAGVAPPETIEPFTFQIVTNKGLATEHHYCFRAPNRFIMDMWVQSIRETAERIEEDSALITRTQYRVPFADKMSMALGIFGSADSSTRLKLVGKALSLRIEQLKVKMVKILDRDGLFGLNKILLSYNGKQICQALQIVAEADNHPLYVHCSHGKDRTGLICALTLRILGASMEYIAEDYHISEASASTPKSREIFKKHSPHLSLNKWCVAPKEVMQRTFEYIEEKDGSFEQYLDRIGFDEFWRHKMRTALLVGSRDAIRPPLQQQQDREMMSRDSIMPNNHAPGFQVQEGSQEDSLDQLIDEVQEIERNELETKRTRRKKKRVPSVELLGSSDWL